MSSQLEIFEENLDHVRTAVTRTSPVAFQEALADVVDQPVVGAPLPFDDISLEGTDIVLGPTPDQLREAACGVTAASLAVADYGSVVLESTPTGSELSSLFPERHVVVVRERDVVADMAAAFEHLGERFREGQTDAIIATGPSATADMGALVYGAHGPRETHAIVVEEEDNGN